MSNQLKKRNLMLHIVRSLMQPAITPAAVVLVLLVGGAISDAQAKTPPAAAGPVLTEKSVAVKVDDLDLTTDAGIKAANERILGAARKACNFTTNAGDYVVGRKQVFRACLDRTVAAASGRLEQLRLAALLHSGAPIDSATSSVSRQSRTARERCSGAGHSTGSVDGDLRRRFASAPSAPDRSKDGTACSL